MMHTNEPIKESFKSQVETEKVYRRRNHLTDEQKAKKTAALQVERFLGRHFYTSEPCGLVF